MLDSVQLASLQKPLPARLIWLEPTIKSPSPLRMFLRPLSPSPLDFLSSTDALQLEECSPVLPAIYGPSPPWSPFCVLLLGRHFDRQPHLRGTPGSSQPGFHPSRGPWPLGPPQQMCPGCNFPQLPWFPCGQPGHPSYGRQGTSHPGLSPAAHTA